VETRIPDPRRLPRTAVLALAAVALAGSTAGCAGSSGSPSTAVRDRDTGSVQMLTVTSPGFVEGSALPERYAMQKAGGRNVSIPLSWSGVPQTARSLVIVTVDRHPIAHRWIHWLVTGVSPDATGVPEGASGSAAMPAGARERENSFGLSGWGGPQPPPGSGAHPYETTVYALSVSDLSLPGRPTLADVERAVAGKVLASGMLTGTYQE
jgi:Raf kinase inhibitor-like YbhB/YbcL family protein